MFLVYIWMCLTMGMYGVGSSKTCPAPQVYNGECPTACPAKCSDPLSLNPFRLCPAVCGKPGCYCPHHAPIEKCDKDLNVGCVVSGKQCCVGGTVWDECGNVCTRTCKTPFVFCKAMCYPHCVCPDKKPIWHQGKCIKLDQCTCPNKKMTMGCEKCKKCDCTKGKKLCPLLKKECPDVKSDQGLKEILGLGCYRMSPGRDQCIFYSPCIDENHLRSCDTNPKGFCKDCCRCRCSKGGEAQCDVKIIGCDQHFMLTAASTGCWALVKQVCRFVIPCPEQPSKVSDGTCKKHSKRSCKNCQSCQCVNGVDICDRQPPCKDPTRGKSKGCFVKKKRYPDCEYVSPCPQYREPCPNDIDLPQGEIKKDFCYKLNKKTKRCDFVSPCPGKCKTGENVCNKCNECNCKKGEIVCTRKKCGDPIAKGCWTKFGNNCMFRSPCPAFHERCEDRPQEEKLSEPNGCWSQIHGTCEFFFPCDNLS